MGATQRARGSVRVRTAGGAVVIVAVAVIVMAVAFDWLLGRELRQSLDRQLEARVTDRVALLDGGADPSSVLTVLGDEEFVVVFDASGGVAASAGIAEPDDVAAIAPGRVADLTVLILKRSEGEVDDETLRVTAAATSRGETVVVGVERSAATYPRNRARRYLYVGVPLTVLAAAVGAWMFVGRALRPVERMRRDVESLAADTEGDRVGVPNTDDELRQLAVTMNDLLDRIETERSARLRFVSDASHELKSPVANVRVLLDTTDDDPREWAAQRDRLRAEMVRMGDLVEDLLFLARRDERSETPASTVVHLDDVVFDEAEAAQTGRDTRVDAGGVQPADVTGDRAQLARVVRNLLANAVRHARSEVRVTLTTARDGVLLTVDDDGGGIAPEHRDAVFDRFVRLDADRARADGGTGLGLAIVRSIVTLHRGTVTVADSELGGARFEVRLPLDDGAADSPGAAI